MENRVKVKIREKVNSSSWRHIPGKLNPADIATRKCRPKVLPQLWFHGREFLKLTNEKWPLSETVLVSILPEAGIEELSTKLTVNALSMTKSNEFGIEKIIDCKRFSNLKKFLVVSALVLRFAGNMKCILTGKERIGGEVTLLEVRNSESERLKFEQHFIIQGRKFQKQKHSLNLYFDENDILRSQTRINQIKGVVLQESQPIPHRLNSYFTVKKMYYVSFNTSQMCSAIFNSLLPEHRVYCDFPFQHVGVDYAGPLYVPDNYSKSTELFKAYILVFTCATTQYAHLELVADFTTEEIYFPKRKAIFFHM